METPLKLHPEHYHKIAQAISYIREHAKQQPSLEAIAARAGLSPFHFQRIFVQGTGITPKKFLQYTTLESARSYLRSQAPTTPTLFDAACNSGLSGTGRLHELFVNFEAMTPAEFRDGGAQLRISYQVMQSPFGLLLVANTTRGICRVSFVGSEKEAEDELKTIYPNAAICCREQVIQEEVLQWFGSMPSPPTSLGLHLRGTAFQLQVWEALLQIPEGEVTTYGAIASAIGKPEASRAVGTAIGANPVAFLIPCHRVIRGDGKLGGYMWGMERKELLLSWEQARIGVE